MSLGHMKRSIRKTNPDKRGAAGKVLYRISMGLMWRKLIKRRLISFIILAILYTERSLPVSWHLTVWGISRGYSMRPKQNSFCARRIYRSRCLSYEIAYDEFWTKVFVSTETPYPIRIFVKGSPYKIRSRESNVHLFGVDNSVCSRGKTMSGDALWC